MWVSWGSIGGMRSRTDTPTPGPPPPLVFEAARHRYRLDGRPVTGVTTIIDRGLPKPAIAYWAARVVAEAAVDDADDLAGQVSARGRDSVIRRLKRAPWRARDEAAARGTEVHALAERVVVDDAADVPVRLAPHVAGYADFLDAHDVEPLLTEVRVASRRHWYAGTADLIARMGGQTWVLDLKTSNSIHGSYALQCAAYARADFYLDASGAEAPMPRVDRIGAVHVRPEGARLVEFPDLQAAWEAFLAVKAVADITDTIDSWGDRKR